MLACAQTRSPGQIWLYNKQILLTKKKKKPQNYHRHPCGDLTRDSGTDLQVRLRNNITLRTKVDGVYRR